MLVFTTMNLRALCALTLLALVACRTGAPQEPLPRAAPEFKSPFGWLELFATLEPASTLPDDTLGGLSGIAWEPREQVLLAISDDRGEWGPVRFYEFSLDISKEKQAGRWEPTRRVELLDLEGRPFAAGSIDPESIAFSGESVLITSEGTEDGPPFIGVFDRDGRQTEELALPEYLLPGRERGVRLNLGLEAVSALPSGVVVAGIENALVQDGPEAGVGVPSPARILRWNADGGRQEFVYWTDPVIDAPESTELFHTNGLVELLALDADRLLALERSYTAGFPNGIRLYLVDLSRAIDVAGQAAVDPAAVVPAEKELLANLSDLGFALDNLEGLSWGPDLPDGRRTLLAVSDDNFDPMQQRTHLLVFAVGDTSPSIPEIQGAGHRSAFEDTWLFGVEGTVTQVRPDEEGADTAWIQSSGDGDPATADGLRILFDDLTLSPGMQSRAHGFLTEVGRDGELSVTTLIASRVEVLGESPVPEAVRLDPTAESNGSGVRRFPRLPFDDDGMAGFNPAASAIDLLESLEGMRVALPAATVVSGTSPYGEIALWPAGAEGVRSSTGAVVITPEGFNPQRLIAVGTPCCPAPQVNVGDRLESPISGVLDYAFSNYRLVVDDWPPIVARSIQMPTVPWSASAEDFTFATYNALNLDPGDGIQFERLAASILAGLASPDLIALQEIQDDNGPEDEGVTSAHRTLTMLIDAIREAGGPDYEYAQIDPIHDSEGGQPVGNIRVAYLYRPDRVKLVASGNGDSHTSTAVTADGGFSLSPGRVAVDHPAFAGDDAEGWEPSRRCLAATFAAGGERWQFVNCHLKSKRGDDRLFGGHQPPVFHTESQRSSQAEVLALLSREILSADPGARLIVLGDTNDHEFRQPIRILEAAGLTNLVAHVPPAERYTYNFNGNSQVLDNVLVSPAIAACSPEVAIVHWNTDLADAERASDHDPVAVRVPDC